MLLAHARRKFYDAKDYDNAGAEKILTEIQRLYEIEAHCRDECLAPGNR